MNPYLIRGYLLLRQERHADAAEQAQLALAENPENVHAYLLLSRCLCEMERFADATEAAQTAIAKEPANSECHYALASVMVQRNRLKEALAAIDDALMIDPGDPTLLGLKALILLLREDASGALACAELGLESDPEDHTCTNIRAQALTRLRRSDDADAALDTALERNPEDAWTHANKGWNFLHAGQAKEAMGHFAESLRLDPDSEYARNGYVEATKARNPMYGVLLNVLLALGRLRSRHQWALVLGIWIGIRLISRVGRAYPVTEPWVPVFLQCYIAASMLLWLGMPIFDLVIWASPMGRHILAREKQLQSALLATLLGLVGVVMWTGIIVGHYPWNELFHDMGMRLICFAFLVQLIFECDMGWRRWTLAGYSMLVALVSLVVIVGVTIGVLLHLPREYFFFVPLWLSTFWPMLFVGIIGGAILSLLPSRR